MTLSDEIRHFSTYCGIERQLSSNTRQAYLYDLADFEKWFVTQSGLDFAVTACLRAYLDHLVTTRKLSVSTVRRRIACLRAFFRFLSRKLEIADPFTGWELKLPRRKRLPRTLSRCETSSLLAQSASQTSLGVEVRLLISTGIRVGEFCKIQIGDLSSDGATLRVRGKGSKDRVVFIADAGLRIALAARSSKRRATSLDSEPLFLNRKGAAIRPPSIRTKLRDFAQLSGLQKRVTPHMLRHTAATLLIERGVDIRIVQRLLGHSSIATTEIYTHVSDETLRSSLERADILGSFANSAVAVVS